MKNQNKLSKKRKLVTNKFYSAPVSIGRKYLKICFPVSVAPYIDADNSRKIFWVPINGTIQISGNVPRVVLPLMTPLKENLFVPL